MMPRGMLLAATVLIMSGVAQASPYSQVFAFGDSLSDAGNLYIATSNPANGVPLQPVAPYSLGRFSNGNVWVQDLSLQLGDGALLPSLSGGTDFAFGGANTGTTLAHTAIIIDLPSQVAQFQSRYSSAPANALFTLSIGSNDLLEAGEAVAGGQLTPLQALTVASQAAQNTAAAVSSLQQLGARRLVLYDVPDLGLTPDLQGIAAASATALAAAYNADVVADLAPVEAAGLTVDILGEFAKLEATVKQPGLYGFSNATDPCWTGNYTDPTSGTLCSATTAGQDAFLFWDGLHPTEAAQAGVANDALARITPVPEPSGLVLFAASLLMLVACGTRADRATRWRRARGATRPLWCTSRRSCGR